MIRTVRWFAWIVLLTMVGVTTWASMHCALWMIPPDIIRHPWFIATLADTYWAFLTFYLWVFYKERHALPRVAWLLSILLLGNLAMAIYLLVQIAKLPQGAGFEALLLKEAQKP